MLTIRNMIENDVEAVASLEHTIFTDSWTEKSIYDTFCQKQAFVTIAESEEKIVGYCIVYFVLDEAEIARIAVDFNERRQGVGHRLLEEVERICTEKQIAKLLLDVRESNASARRFYCNYGFEEDGVRKDFYENPREDAILMSMATKFASANKD